MNYFQFFAILFFANQFCFAQITESGLEKFKQEIEKEVIKVRQELNKENYSSDFDKQITIDFKIDTLKINMLHSKEIETNYSTSAMVNASYEAEVEYDKLLNKYYQILIKKLSPTDKEVLKQSQKNWIQFRDSERNLNSIISKDEYSGGGTIQRIVIANNYLEITKQRLFEIFDYLSKFEK